MTYTIEICPLCGKQDWSHVGICQHFDPDERYIDCVEVEVQVIGLAERVPSGPPNIRGPFKDE